MRNRCQAEHNKKEVEGVQHPSQETGNQRGAMASGNVRFDPSIFQFN
jgi:hypothetical protein